MENTVLITGIVVGAGICAAIASGLALWVALSSLRQVLAERKMREAGYPEDTASD